VGGGLERIEGRRTAKILRLGGQKEEKGSEKGGKMFQRHQSNG
jgi:hypothetical protein